MKQLLNLFLLSLLIVTSLCACKETEDSQWLVSYPRQEEIVPIAFTDETGTLYFDESVKQWCVNFDNQQIFVTRRFGLEEGPAVIVDNINDSIIGLAGPVKVSGTMLLDHILTPRNDNGTGPTIWVYRLKVSKIEGVKKIKLEHLENFIISLVVRQIRHYLLLFHLNGMQVLHLSLLYYMM